MKILFSILILLIFTQIHTQIHTRNNLYSMTTKTEGYYDKPSLHKTLINLWLPEQINILI